LGNVAIGHALGGHGGDPPLARGESLDAGEDEATRPRAGRDELSVGALDERLRAVRVIVRVSS
jgi:hypothetical protein